MLKLIFMRNYLYKFLLVALVLSLFSNTMAQERIIDPEIQKYIKIIRENIFNDYKGMLKEPAGTLEFPFITPGSSQYVNQLWDWDAWFTNIALRQIVLDTPDKDDEKEIVKYERGCALNFLNFENVYGYIPVLISPKSELKVPSNLYDINIHKPVMAQHVAFLVKSNNGDAEWIRDKFYMMQCFVNNYRNFRRSKETGLYYWATDSGTGVDNDPTYYYRPFKSTGSIYLNCFMYKELNAMVYLANRLNFPGIAEEYQEEADKLKDAIQEHCWDERDGFFYSVDLNLLPISKDPVNKEFGSYLHGGYPRDYDCLIMRIGVWSGFLAMWSGIATPEQAKRMVEEHLLNEKTFGAAYGVRTLSKMEKMYSVRASGNPSCWLGPIWGVSNYLVFRGLVKYGFNDEAQELAEKTIRLFGKDFERSGALHEYYEPENGEPILLKGFQNWNYLVMNMANWLEGKTYVEEF